MSLYKDLDSKFRGHPVKKDLLYVTDAQAVANSVKMIVMTNFYERPFNSRFGGNVRGLLFELADNDSTLVIKDRVKGAIEKWEPRAVVLDVQAQLVENELRVSVHFRLLNKTEVNRTEITLRTVR